ncbi:hypothetical protein [Archangium gephyra]|uniref:hypothetical protein n=1 Tax=Archangium gephyra TaxID=48 RepID=UPI0035D3F433
MTSPHLSSPPSIISERMLSLLLADPPLALDHAAHNPADAPVLLSRLLVGPPLASDDLQDLLTIAAAEEFPLELRRMCALMAVDRKDVKLGPTFLDALAHDCEQEPALIPLLLQLAEGVPLRSSLLEDWLEVQRAEVRELAARSLLTREDHRTRAMEMLLKDGRRDIIEQAARESADAAETFTGLLGYVQLKRCVLQGASREALLDVMKAFLAPKPKKESMWTPKWETEARVDWALTRRHLSAPEQEELEPIPGTLEGSKLAVKFLLQEGMAEEAVQILCLWKAQAWAGMLEGIGATPDRRMEMRQLAEALAKLPAQQWQSTLRFLPLPLVTIWARSPKTPLEVRFKCAWRVLQAPGFNPRDCDFSTDPELLAELLEQLDELQASQLPILRVLLRAAVNLLVREPPSAEELEEQASPHFRIRDRVRLWSRQCRRFDVSLAKVLRDDLETRVWSALRRVRHVSNQLHPPAATVGALLRCTAVLQDRRHLEAVKHLEKNLSAVERRQLSEPLLMAKEMLLDPPLTDHVTVVSMAIAELRLK